MKNSAIYRTLHTNWFLQTCYWTFFGLINWIFLILKILSINNMTYNAQQN